MPEKSRSQPETVTMASDEPQLQLPAGLRDPTTERTAARMVADEEKVLGADGALGKPWGALVLAPTPLSIAPPCPDEYMPAASAQGEKRCVQCGATETPQWRIHPTGLGVLCNACRIRLRPAEALREPVHVHRPSPATATAPEEKKQERKSKPCHPRKSSQHLPPPPAQAYASVGGDLQMGDPSSLDQFLFDGPAAPMLIDGDDEDLMD